MPLTQKQKDEVFAGAIKKWGIPIQTLTAAEEAAEFIQALSKYTRKPNPENLAHLAEEIADCRNMLGQIEWLYNIQRECALQEEIKLNRTMERIAGSPV